jgi:hypothetical protein
MLQLILFFVATVLILVNSLRLNLKWKLIGGASYKLQEGGFLSDIVLNGISFFLGVQAITCLACLPMQVLLTRIIPPNVEASMQALIAGAFVFTMDVGCKWSGSFFLYLFDVDNEKLDRYWIVLSIKLPLILVTMLFV